MRDPRPADCSSAWLQLWDKGVDKGPSAEHGVTVTRLASLPDLGGAGVGVAVGGLKQQTAQQSEADN